MIKIETHSKKRLSIRKEIINLIRSCTYEKTVLFLLLSLVLVLTACSNSSNNNSTSKKKNSDSKETVTIKNSFEASGKENNGSDKKNL